MTDDYERAAELVRVLIDAFVAHDFPNGSVDHYVKVGVDAIMAAGAHSDGGDDVPQA